MSSGSTAQDEEIARAEMLPQAAGFDVDRVRHNDYRFTSERALDACGTYEVQSISLVAVKAA